MDRELWSENLQCEVTLRVVTDMTQFWFVNMLMKCQVLKRVGDYQLRSDLRCKFVPVFSFSHARIGAAEVYLPSFVTWNQTFHEIR